MHIYSTGSLKNLVLELLREPLCDDYCGNDFFAVRDSKELLIDNS